MPISSGISQPSRKALPLGYAVLYTQTRHLTWLEFSYFNNTSWLTVQWKCKPTTTQGVPLLQHIFTFPDRYILPTSQWKELDCSASHSTQPYRTPNTSAKHISKHNTNTTESILALVWLYNVTSHLCKQNPNAGSQSFICSEIPLNPLTASCQISTVQQSRSFVFFLIINMLISISWVFLDFKVIGNSQACWIFVSTSNFAEVHIQFSSTQDNNHLSPCH